MMGGLSVGIPALLVLLGTIFIGGMFVLISWLLVVSKVVRTQQWNIPTPIWLLTAAILADCVGAKALDATPSDGAFFFSIRDYWFLSMLLSFSLVVISFFMLRLKSAQSIRLLRVASVTLLVLNVAGLALYILARPGMPLN
jgi:hypothetical protein